MHKVTPKADFTSPHLKSEKGLHRHFVQMGTAYAWHEINNHKSAKLNFLSFQADITSFLLLWCC